MKTDIILIISKVSVSFSTFSSNYNLKILIKFFINFLRWRLMLWLFSQNYNLIYTIKEIRIFLFLPEDWYTFYTSFFYCFLFQYAALSLFVCWKMLSVVVSSVECSFSWFAFSISNLCCVNTNEKSRSELRRESKKSWEKSHIDNHNNCVADTMSN